jgi:hypothetical protein
MELKMPSPWFVVFNTTMEQVLRKNSGTRYFDTERGAKIVCSKLNKEANTNEWITLTNEEWKTRPVTTVERVNLMTGEKYMEPVNTPNFMSPAFYAYWAN